MRNRNSGGFKVLAKKKQGKEEMKFKANYGMVAVSRDDLYSLIKDSTSHQNFIDRLEELNVKHMCCYENPPDGITYFSLLYELMTDEDLDLVGEDLILVPAPNTMIEDALGEDKEVEFDDE